MYNYQKEKQKVFTEEGQLMFMQIRDNVKKLLEQSGAVMLDNAIRVVTGDSWLMLACIDRIVELGEIREIPQDNPAGQHRIFAKPY